jgi:tight adherence protein B
MISVTAFAAAAALVVGLASLHSTALTRGPVRPAPGAPTATCRPPQWVEELVTAAGRSTDAARAWRLLGRSVPVALAVVAVAVGPVSAVVLAAALAATPRGLRTIVRRRLHDRRDAQLPDSLERLASALRAGSSPTTAFVSLAHEAPEPLGAELRVVAAEVEHGAGMAAAVGAWAAHQGASPAVRLAASALSLGVAAGGEVARSMDRVAATLRERRELQAEVHSLATQARASAGVLGMAPLGFTALVSTIEPGMVRFLVTTPIGLLCLAAGLALEVAGILWMARIVAAAS